MSTAVYESPQEARLVRAFLFLAIYRYLPLYPLSVHSPAHPRQIIEPRDTSRNEAIRDKTPPLSDTALAGLEPDANEYRELDGSGFYFRVKPDGKWSWLGLGGYPEVSGSVARQKTAELRTDAAVGENPNVTKHYEAHHRRLGASRIPGVRQ